MKSGGAYRVYTDPARFLKLLLDNKTGRTLNSMLVEKVDANLYISIKVMVDTLSELICSRKTINIRRKEFFGAYNTPLLMGKEGDKIDRFITQLSRDSAACCLESFRWTNYNVLICINTLRGSNKDKAKLAERLTLLYNTHCESETIMTLATVQSEVKSSGGL